ncbi:MAG: hypothetical protein WED04_09570 [Promethearchaeati archaeon SRVP18_Atabeyarchaeia-1]
MEEERIDEDMETLLKKLLTEKEFEVLRDIVRSRGDFKVEEGE